MKKENLTLQLLLIVICILCIHLFAGCVKGENECRTCTAKDTGGTTLREEQICSSEEETSFRDEYSGFTVECK